MRRFDPPGEGRARFQDEGGAEPGVGLDRGAGRAVEEGDGLEGGGALGRREDVVAAAGVAAYHRGRLALLPEGIVSLFLT